MKLIILIVILTFYIIASLSPGAIVGIVIGELKNHVVHDLIKDLVNNRVNHLVNDLVNKLVNDLVNDRDHLNKIISYFKIIYLSFVHLKRAYTILNNFFLSIIKNH